MIKVKGYVGVICGPLLNKQFMLTLSVKRYTFRVMSIDNETPVLKSCPANQTSNVDPGQSTALIEWQDPSATDNSGDSPTVVCNPPSGTKFTIGSTKCNVHCF